MKLKLPKVDVLSIEKKEYVLMSKKEYSKIEKFIKQYMEDLEDSRLIDESLKDTESYTIDEAAKMLGVDMDEVRNKK